MCSCFSVNPFQHNPRPALLNEIGTFVVGWVSTQA